MITIACINEQIERLQKIWGKQVFDAEDERGVDRRRALAEVLATAETEYAAQSAVSALIQEHGRVYAPTPGELVTALESAPEVPPESERTPKKTCLLCGGTGYRWKHFNNGRWVGDFVEHQIGAGTRSGASFTSAVERCSCW